MLLSFVLALTISTPLAFTADLGQILVIGGWNGTGRFADVLSLDIQTGIWSFLPSIPTAANGVSAALMGNVLYAIAGRPTFTQVLTMDMTTPGNGWSTAVPLPKSVNNGGSGFSVKDVAYVAGGLDNEIGVFVLPKGATSWIAGANSTNPHCWSEGDVYEDKFYFCGTVWPNKTTVCERYNTATNIWESDVAPMLLGRTGHSLVTHRRYVYAIGGSEGRNERYDADSNYWQFIRALPSPRYGSAVASDGTYIYSIGGHNFIETEYYDTVLMYNDIQDLWSQIGRIPSGRDDTACIFIPPLGFEEEKEKDGAVVKKLN